MKTLDKKIFVILKYIIISIPLIIGAIYLFNNYFIGHETTKLLATEQNENVWQYRDNQYDNYEGGAVMDFWVDSVRYGEFSPVVAFKRAIGDVYNDLPHISITIENNTTDTDPITYAMAKIANKTNSYSQFSGFKTSAFGAICQYLYYFILIELLWAIIYLFRWFIQFGYGLFEKERKL